ncbi:hypothetical protein FNF27_04066 [Cafeteria roenbergensis]|uniref:CKK domain-containing protein n=1 Tax=Cafeteria roenbergensis TaxID=33653 RepID=A0A5A8D332_CAFRO|nr:hypothetical protein FNF29_03311 [Cafeteria roenbergensis]KAA0159853.1 hypothetical protein FNF31_04655 [Cafeteria roenbergensis]KAA0162793.1 hypothetical protein FNF28_04550 [Cafeteria roenbergensis]KAA0170770.1 hypothetical protein FNF28_01312 [Cafeteria roenbergensis]KAA0174470.1 hypothetical protein FNF27_04066 [Cafeteria roenbergensis]|eukprot:KAA0153123.1 hypothetical protein FNF29_03311 [Cafeteria roenbergensis]
MRTRTTASDRRASHRRLCGALSRVLLAGVGLEGQRERALAAVAGAPDRHVVAAFRGGGTRHGPFLGLYAMDDDSMGGTRVFAASRGAPLSFDRASVQAFYKYDTVSRSFDKLDAVRFTPRTNGVSLSLTR